MINGLFRFITDNFLSLSQQQSLPNPNSNKYHRNKATSALESTTEYKHPLQRASKGVTVIVDLRFWLKTIAHTQGIFMFDQANAMEREAHDEWMAARGRKWSGVWNKLP